MKVSLTCEKCGQEILTFNGKISVVQKLEENSSSAELAITDLDNGFIIETVVIADTHDPDNEYVICSGCGHISYLDRDGFNE